MRRPSTRMSSSEASAFVPSSRTVVPFTVTRPSSISCSDARLEAIPACDRIFWRRSTSLCFLSAFPSSYYPAFMRKLIIAIDGPSGAGKGTVARAVAAELGYRHIDSGAMYRAVGWKALKLGIPFDREDDIVGIAEASTIDISAGTVSIDGTDVTRAIRTPEIDRAAASVARLPKVRAVLVDHQRALGVDGGIVMEGRDIGTVVFPGADVKVYLDAAAEERARRRATDPAHTGVPAAIAE